MAVGVSFIFAAWPLGVSHGLHLKLAKFGRIVCAHIVSRLSLVINGTRVYLY